MGTSAGMSDPIQRASALDDAPTTQTQAAPVAQSTTPRQSPASPPSWQPAGWAGTQEAEPITWTPVASEPVVAARSGRGRWIVALLVALIVAVAAVGVSVFALGSRTNAAVGPTFLPQSTPLYVEARLDLPGTQRDNVVKLLSHFPGFADPASFDLKVDETFDKLIRKATGDKVSYTTDVKPWFGGQIAVGLLQIPAAMTRGAGAMASPLTPGSVAREAAMTHAVAGLSIKDRSRLDTLLTGLRSLATNITFTQEQYRDHTVVAASRGGTAAGAYTVSDTLLLVAGNSADLQTALDVLDGKAPSLAADAGFSSAMKELPAERLGAIYAGSAYFQAASEAFTKLQDSGAAVAGAGAGALRCLVPAGSDPANSRVAAALVASGDSVALQSRATGMPPMAIRTTSDLAAHVPADALFYAEVPKAGGSLHDLIACLRVAMPEAFSGTQVKQLEQALGTKLEEYLSFVTDVGVAVSYDAGRFHWGIVAGVDNEETAKSRVASLVGIARLAGGMGQAPLSVAEQQVGGATVSTITVSNADGLGKLPVDPSVSVAVVSGHLYLGGGDFAAGAVARSAADSLASNTRYSSALAAAGSPNGMTFYLDVDALRQRIEASGAANQDYVTNVQPYLKPFDRLVFGSSQGADNLTGRLQLFVK